MQYIRIKSYEQYQHYKERNPPWIKLHIEILSGRTWVMLDDASRVLAITLMLLASKNDNKIPCDKAYLQRVAYLNGEPDLSRLLEMQFIEVIDENGNVQADAHKCLQMITNARPETETDTTTDKSTEGEGAKKRPASKRFVKPSIKEIKDYSESIGATTNAVTFFNHYETVGWLVGKNKLPMKDWKAAVRGWNSRENK